MYITVKSNDFDIEICLTCLCNYCPCWAFIDLIFCSFFLTLQIGKQSVVNVLKCIELIMEAGDGSRSDETVDEKTAKQFKTGGNEKATKNVERLEKLKTLKQRRFEAKRLNRAEVVEEDRKSKLPSNWERRQQRAEWKLADIHKRKECEEKGLDYDRVKVMDITASDAERVDVLKKRKKDPDQGFSSKPDCLKLWVIEVF